MVKIFPMSFWPRVAAPTTVLLPSCRVPPVKAWSPSNTHTDTPPGSLLKSSDPQNPGATTSTMTAGFPPDEGVMRASSIATYESRSLLTLYLSAGPAVNFP
jgi:hypothetical protein